MIYLAERETEAGLNGREKRRGQSEAARRLLLFGLSREYGMCRLPEIKRSIQGKPYFPEHPEIKFNYSHCARGILCGVSGREIGVDIERLIPFRERLVKHICHENELRLFRGADSPDAKSWLLTRLWTAKESFVKCTGTGIRVRLSELDFSGCIDGGLFEGEYQMTFGEGPDYGIAVCQKAEGGQGEALSVRRLSPEELRQVYN